MVIISGHGNIETAVTAIKRGAYDYIEKPFKADRLLLVTLRALEASKLQREVRELRERSAVSFEMIGKSTAINQLRGSHRPRGADQQPRADPRRRRLGQGAVRARHARHLARARTARSSCSTRRRWRPTASRRSCSAPRTTAGPRKVGALEEAHGGTLYIDEVADMPLETQGKVLRVLVEQKFQRVGGGPKVSVDVRIISSTSRDLEREMQEGRFREDLYHRLNVVPLRVPGLAERRDDIPELITYFVGQVAQSSGLAPRKIGEDAIAVLQAHDWPGNVRELRNNIERLMILVGRRSRRHHHRQHAARGDRLQRAAAGQRRRRAPDVAAAARGARDLRARVPAGADQPLRRQHLAHGRVRRHGALGAASQAAGAGRQLAGARHAKPCAQA